MGKITQVNNNDSGLVARTKINEAMKTVETDSSLSGSGTVGDPLKVVGPGGGDVTEEYADLFVAANIIQINCNGKNHFTSSNIVAVSADATVTFSNETNVRTIEFDVDISNSATLTFPVDTFPSGTISGDSRWVSPVLSFGEKGIYNVSLKRSGSTYILIVSQTPAV